MEKQIDNILENKLWKFYNLKDGYKTWNPLSKMKLSDYIFYAKNYGVNVSGLNFLLGYIKENLLDILELSKTLELKLKFTSHIDTSVRNCLDYVCDKTILNLTDFKESIEISKNLKSFWLEKAYSYFESNVLTINFCGGITEYYINILKDIKNCFVTPTSFNISKAIKTINNEIINLKIDL